MILLVTLTFVAIGVAFDRREETGYKSTVTIEVRSSFQTAPVLFRRRSRPETDPATATARLGSAILPEAIDGATRRLAKRYPTATDLRGQPVAVPLGPGLAQIGVISPSPLAAKRIAEALGDAVVAELRKGEVRAIDRLLRVTKRNQRRARRGQPDDLLTDLVQQTNQIERARLEILRSQAQGGAIISAARLPTTPATRRGRRLAPMLFMGFSLALLAAFLLDVFDRRPRDPRLLADAAGLPLAGSVPRIRRGRDYLESFGALRAVVEGAAEPPPRVVAVTSPLGGDGKTTLVAGLADAVAAAGLRACVVEGDLRRPVLAGRLGIEGNGLRELLAGSGDVEASIRQVPTGDRTVDVLPAGAPAPRAASLLEGPALGELLAVLAERYDMVLVDCPPLSAGVDAQLLARHADLVLVSANAGHTPSDELARARVSLERATAAPLLLAVSRVQRPARAMETWEPSRRRRLPVLRSARGRA